MSERQQLSLYFNEARRKNYFSMRQRDPSEFSTSVAEYRSDLLSAIDEELNQKDADIIASPYPFQPPLPNSNPGYTAA